MNTNVMLLVLMTLSFLMNQNGTADYEGLFAVASNGKDGIIMGGRTKGSWAKGVVGYTDFVAVLLDVQATHGPTPSPTVSSPTRFPTQSPTIFNPTGFPTPLQVTLRPARFETYFPTILSPTEAPVDSKTIPPSTALIAGAAAGGVALLLIVIILIVYWRRRAATQNVHECRIPRLEQARRIPARTRGTDTPRSTKGDAILDPLPGYHVRESDVLEAKPINRMDEGDTARAADRVRGFNMKTTDLGSLNSTADDTDESKEAASALPPTFDSRDNSGPDGAATTRALKMPSSNRGSSGSSGTLPISEILSVAEAVIETANAVASSSHVPIVSEAAALISALVRLAVEYQSNDGAAECRIRWCRSILAMLRQASEILGKGEDGTIGAEEQPLLEDVYDSVSNLVGIIRTYEAKSKCLKLFVSSIFKRRQDEAEAIINNAISRLQLGLQVETRYKLAAIAQDVQEGLNNVKGLESDYAARALTESRRTKRQRRIQQLEIPEDQVTLTDVLLGKGGFGEVFLADFSGINAAAKVIQVDNEQPRPAGQGDGVCTDGECIARPTYEQARQRRLFKRELETMTRLNSSHTVRVYGAITSRVDRFVLVMELMTGGDLRTLLRQAEASFPRDRALGIISNICFGMAFLHKKGAVHGDLKSANVLFDRCGTAKIADFGTAKWVQHGVSTGLATTYLGTKATNSTQMSIPWTAPEVLDNDPASFKSDVYSFGIIAWEIASRQMPWAGLNGRMIFRRVVFAGDRPEIPNDATEEMKDVIRSCWSADPTARPNFCEILDTMKSWTT